MDHRFPSRVRKPATAWLVAAVALLGSLQLLRAPAAAQVAQEPSAPIRVPVLPDRVEDYTPNRLPEIFRARPVTRQDNMPASNRTTDAGATLGRVLFYDTALSANDTTSCASCHSQETGFSSTERFGVGFEGGHTARKPMGLSNARFYASGRFFWDERAATLEEQVLMPIQDEIEMGMALDVLEAKLQGSDYYPPLFEGAFGSESVTSERISLALAQFVRSLLSYQSRYDEGLANSFADYTAQEAEGMDLFTSPRTRCVNCHRGTIQSANQPRNNGLDRVSRDLGVRGITGDLDDDGEFKTPSLRNIALRAPYMHDGRFDTLRAVIDFYDDGVQNHRNLDPLMEGRNNGPRRLNLTSREKLALVAFLETLTDEAFVNDPKFADPFVEVVPTATPLPTDTPAPTATREPTPTEKPTAIATATATVPLPDATATPPTVVEGRSVYLPLALESWAGAR